MLARLMIASKILRPSLTRMQMPSTTATVRMMYWGNRPSTTVSLLKTIQRGYGGSAVLTKNEIEERVLGVLRAFDRLSLDAKFATDLGLDSLDVVEALIAVEEEFHLEIPDDVADRLESPRQAVEYIWGLQEKQY